MRIAVLVSGSGTNLQALIDAALAPAEIAVVISNRPGVMALDRARAAGLVAITIDHRAYPDRAGFEAELLSTLAEHRVEALVLAGFMRILTAQVVERFAGRIINTHPSLLPAFPGAHAIADALAYRVALSGVTVHFVDASLDGGPIIAQHAVPVTPDDDETSLRQRLQAVEHRLLPLVVRSLASGGLVCEGRVVRGAPTL